MKKEVVLYGKLKGVVYKEVSTYVHAKAGNLDLYDPRLGHFVGETFYPTQLRSVPSKKEKKVVLVRYSVASDANPLSQQAVDVEDVWFLESVTSQLPEGAAPATEEEWNEFNKTVEDAGNNMLLDIAFQQAEKTVKKQGILSKLGLSQEDIDALL